MRCNTKFLLIAAFLIAAGISATALKCYHCTADTAITCNRTEKVKTCRHSNPICITLAFTIIKDDVHQQIKEWNFENRCAPKDIGCKAICSLQNAEDCTVSCCEHNLCNKALQGEKVVVTHKRRNNVMDMRGAANSLSNPCLLLVLFTLFFFHLSR